MSLSWRKAICKTVRKAKQNDGKNCSSLNESLIATLSEGTFFVSSDYARVHSKFILMSRALFFLFVVLCVSPSILSGHTAKKIARAPDPAYSSALAAVNRFLHAWQTQDHETGIMMLTDSARQQVSRKQLQDFFSPNGDAAFEIRRGHRLSSGEYAFPVVLFGSSSDEPQPRTREIVIVKSGKDDWAVGKLP